MERALDWRCKTSPFLEHGSGAILRQWVRSSESARFVYWSLRTLLGCQPKTHDETMFRIRRHAAKNGWKGPGAIPLRLGQL